MRIVFLSLFLFFAGGAYLVLTKAGYADVPWTAPHVAKDRSAKG